MPCSTGGACLVVGGLIQLSARRPFTTRDLTLFCIGLVVLCGSSALAFPWAGMAVLAALWLSYRDRSLVRLRARNVLWVLGTGLLLLVLLVFDGWAARSGAKPSSVGKTGWLNLLFVGYELLGFIGLGPGRLEIRESQSLSVLAPYSFSLSLLVLVLAIAFFHARGVEKPLWTAFLLYSVVPLVFVTLLALIVPFRLLGRHMTPLAPVLFVLLAYAAATPAKWPANQLFVVLWLISAVMLRIQPRHHRDDYRAAAHEAKDALAKNQTVWWSADSSGALYYGVPLGRSVGGGAIQVIDHACADLAALPAPDLVIASKPDVYDPAATQLGRFLRGQAIRSRPAPAGVYNLAESC